MWTSWFATKLSPLPLSLSALSILRQTRLRNGQLLWFWVSHLLFYSVSSLLTCLNLFFDLTEGYCCSPLVTTSIIAEVDIDEIVLFTCPETNWFTGCMSKESNLKRKRTVVFSYETFYKCLFGYFDDVQSFVLFSAQFIILHDK